MHSRSRSATLSLVISLLLAGSLWAAISITVTGSWSVTIDAADLQSGAGSDLTGTYESATDQIDIDITGTAGPGDTWRVDVSKSDTNWHANFLLYVQRTSDGTGSPSHISGGTTYQEVTDTDQSFFNGERDKSNIDVQLKLEGVSILVPDDTYTTTVTYTVVDT